MKNEIESFNLMYGITTFNIISEYEEFKRCNLFEVANTLNEYFCWLENLKDIDSFNVIYVGEKLLEDKNLRSLVVNEDEQKLYDESRILLEKFNLKDLKKEVLKKPDSFCIKINSFSEDVRNVYDCLDPLKEYLYNSNLIYKDLILLFINNFTFKKRLDRLHEVDWTLDFLNVVNETFNQLDLILQSNRDDLYYSLIWLVSNKFFQDLMFPTYYENGYNIQKMRSNIKKHIMYSIFRSLHSIHKYYYISIKKYNYDNYLRYNSCKFSNKEELIQLILKKLNTSDRIFLIETSSENNYSYSESEIPKLESLINNLRTCDDIIISEQTPDQSILELIRKNVEFVQTYCHENKLEIKDFCYQPNPPFKAGTSQNFLSFYINYKNYDYRFVIRKFNKNLRWAIYLKHEKEYHINLYLEDDFKHLIQAMFND